MKGLAKEERVPKAWLQAYPRHNTCRCVEIQTIKQLATTKGPSDGTVLKEGSVRVVSEVLWCTKI